jgi:hypothetical protein
MPLIPLTGCGFLQQLVDLGSQANDMVGRSNPKDQAVPAITETWLDSRILKPQEGLVNDELLETSIQELLRLLGVSLSPMDGVESLNLSLPQ